LSVIQLFAPTAISYSVYETFRRLMISRSLL